MKNKNVIILFLIAALLAIVSFPFLPERIPIHWNLSGQIDNYGSKWLVFLGPGSILIIGILMEVCRNIDPKKQNYKKFQKQYQQFIFIVCLLMLAVELLTIAASFGADMKVDILLPFAIGLLFIYVGNIFPKIKHNYFMGIKTPWTLNSEEVWYKTHRMAGKLWFVGGIIMAIAAFLPDLPKNILSAGSVIIITIVPMIYSYLISRS